MTTLRSILTVTIKRLLSGLLILLLIGYLSYFGLEMARSQDFSASLVEAADKTITYFGQLAQGDLGMTAANSLSLRPVSIAETVPVIIVRSLGLLLAAMLIAASLGILLGVWAARRRYSVWSLLLLVASIIGVSLPSFFAALLLQIGTIQLTQAMGKTWLPVGGFGWDLHLLLPAVVLAARPLAQTTRITFVTISEILEQDYVRTAHSKGLKDRLVMVKHVFLNAAVPVLTTLSVSLRYSLVSLPVVEFFFSWPGIGFTLLKAIAKQDDNLTVILVLALGILFILLNLLLDLAYRIIDPQLRRAPEHIAHEGGGNNLRDLLNLIRELPGMLQGWLPWRRAAARKAQQPVGRDFQYQQAGEDQDPYDPADGSTRRTWIKGTLKNPALMIGMLFLVCLFGLIILGPKLAPHSPYTTQGLTFVNGEFLVPPFAPDETYPLGTDVLGRDLLSLIIAGVQQTMLLAVLVVLARMLIGFVLGAVAGWLNGSWLDRLIVGVAEVISAFPALLLAMTLILALGIRNGMRPFIIGLCFVGWGEIMQFVRGEVMNIQTRLYIESAVATGLNSLKIIFRHVFPNLAPALISITALEMGAVLMLLGELGFIGIFIGGGAFAELEVFGPPYHYSDVPEWGALLSNVRPYARAYPWTAVYPSLAFFIVILGFNFLGEGLRRLIDIVGFRIMRIFNRYTVAVLLLLGAGFIWLRGQTGSLVYYQKQADGFNAASTLQRIETLADPAWDGRAMGSPGLDAAAQYIAGQFKALGVQAAGDNLTYFQERIRQYASLDEVPRFTIGDSGPEPVYHQDFVERPSLDLNTGTIQAPVHLVAFGELQMVGNVFHQYPLLQDLDYTGQIVMLLSEQEAIYMEGVPHAGLLVVVDDPVALQRHYTLSPVRSFAAIFDISRGQQEIPALWINPELAERLLKNSGQNLSEVRRAADNLGQNEVHTFDMEVTATIEIHATIQERVVANHVIGYIPGTKAGGQGFGPEAQLDNKMIVVMAQYDSAPLGPDGQDYPGANDNASAIALMLEIIRTMRETGYEPYKTILFVAYSGEGFEGGAPFEPQVARFLQTKYGFSDNFEIEAIIELRGLGSSQGENLEIIAGGSLRLANLFEESARRMNTPVRRVGNEIDLSIVFSDMRVNASAEEAPSVGLAWAGWEQTANTPLDTAGSISQENLEAAGRAISLALMTLGRETDY